MSYEQVLQTDQAPSFQDLASSAELLWRSALNPAEGQFPGFAVSHDGERASFTSANDQTLEIVSIFTVGFTWYVRQQSVRPAYEYEGSGGTTVVEDNTYPLTEYDTPTYQKAVGNLHGNGTLMNARVLTNASFDNDGSPLLRSNLQKTFRAIRNEQTEEPRVHSDGWLAKIRGIFR